MKRYYFASDLHLGTPDRESSLQRERIFVQWLDSIKADAKAIYLVGDLFDFWHEYKMAVPRGYTRLLGKLAELSDSGIELHLFTGNHDLWMDDYLEKELNTKVHRNAIVQELEGKRFFIAHGDGLGPADHGYKFIKRVFTNPVCRWLFRWLHPDLGIRLASYLSRRSRYGSGGYELEKFMGEDREWLWLYARRKLQQQHYDYFIFGHRHLPLDIEVQPGSQYINLGDWLDYRSYAVYDGNKVQLCYFQPATTS